MTGAELTLTDEVLRFVEETRFADLEPLAAERAAAAIADCLAVTFLGAASEVGTTVLAALRASGALGGEHPLLGTGETANVLDAALFNGAAAHALDFDDINHPGPMHPSCHLVPALLGADAIAPASGQDWITAFAIGFELDAKLGLLLNPQHYARGWHATSTLGVIGAAATVARVLGLDRNQTEHCLAIAGSGAAGLRGNIGSMTKPLHAGAAARSALLAGLLAREGMTGREQIFDVPHGYLAAFSESRELRTELIRELGRKWEITTEFGLGLKPFACCGEATSAVEAALSIFAEAGGAEVTHVRVATNEHSTRILAFTDPRTVEQARFSLQFCVAAPLVLGRADPDVFADETLADTRVRDLMGRVEHVVDPVHGGEREFGAVVEATLADGRVLTRDIPVVKGWSHRFLTTDEQRAKFVACTRDRMSEQDAGELFDLIVNVARLDDTNVLRARLHGVR
ncbi:MmgE/PrpD family protein [Actinophytocola sp.]|uniref:MmgE/PrpD family protein n=1 Tax=Actinophytocola sp. TaxID=1872138 RepID=UPI003D6AFDF0